MIMFPDRHFVEFICAIALISELLLRCNAYICEVRREWNEEKEWMWTLPHDNLYACGCTQIIMGGLNTWTPIRPFKPVYVNSPLLSSDVNEIRRHYKIICGQHESANPHNDIVITSTMIATNSTTKVSDFETISETALTSVANVTNTLNSNMHTTQSTTTDGDRLTSTAESITTATSILSSTQHTSFDPSTSEAGSCAEGWERFAGHCFYFTHTLSHSFDEARDECTSMDATLTSIHSQEEQNFIGNKTKIWDAGEWWKLSYWIGLKYQEDRYDWIDGTQFNYNNWLSGEPNGKDHHCAAIAPEKTNEWHDIWCDRKYAFVCEKDVDY